MKKPIEKLFAHKDDKIIHVIGIINENELKTAFIVDKNKKLLGIVNDGDIRRAILKNISLTEPVEKIMSKTFFVAKEGVSETEILETIIRHKIFILPILNNMKQVVDYYQITDFIKDEFLKETVKTKTKPETSKKILVTGGAGYIGSTLVRILLDSGYSVRVLDNLSFGISAIKELESNPYFELIQGDYTKIEDLLPCLKNIFAVIHLAAIVGDPAGNINPELTLETNFHGVKILAEFCKYYGIDRFIFTSTCSVYGASDNELLTENSNLNPVSLYAETKLKAEKSLVELKSNNFHPCILRLATVFGLSYRMRFDLVVNLLTALAVKNKEISIFSGEQWRPFVHVKDIANAILNIVNQPVEKVSGQIFNIGKEENNYQIKDLGNFIKKMFPGIKVNKINSKEDQRSYRVSFDKSHKILNFKPEIDLEQGINEIFEFVKKTDVNIKDNQYSNFKKVQCGIFDSIYFAE